MFRTSATSASCRKRGVAFMHDTLPPVASGGERSPRPACGRESTPPGEEPRPDDDDRPCPAPTPRSHAPPAAADPGGATPACSSAWCSSPARSCWAPGCSPPPTTPSACGRSPATCPAGATLAEGDLERRQVRFPDAATADGYLAASDALPGGATLNRPVSAGELLPAGGVGREGRRRPGRGADQRGLPTTSRPPCAQGSAVDVWVSPEVAAVGAGRVRATQVLTDVVVVAVPGSRGQPGAAGHASGHRRGARRACRRPSAPPWAASPTGAS